MNTRSFDRTNTVLRCLLAASAAEPELSALVTQLTANAGLPEHLENAIEAMAPSCTLETIDAVSAVLETHAKLANSSATVVARELRELACSNELRSDIYEYLEATDLSPYGEDRDNPRLIFIFLEAFRPISPGEATQLLRAWKYDHDPIQVLELLPAADEVVAFDQRKYMQR